MNWKMMSDTPILQPSFVVLLPDLICYKKTVRFDFLTTQKKHTEISREEKIIKKYTNSSLTRYTKCMKRHCRNYHRFYHMSALQHIIGAFFSFWFHGAIKYTPEKFGSEEGGRLNKTKYFMILFSSHAFL